MSTRARFASFRNGTQEDWQRMAGEFMPFAQALPDRILAHLKLLEGDFGGFPIDRMSRAT